MRSDFDAQVLRSTLHRFDVLCEAATPEEVQQMVEAMVHRIEWHPLGDSHTLGLYALAQTKTSLYLRMKAGSKVRLVLAALALALSIR